MRNIAVYLLLLGLLPLRANAQTQSPPLDVSLLEMQSLIKNDVETRIKNEILVPVLGKGRSSVFADIELEIVSRTADQSVGRVGVSQQYKQKGFVAGVRADAKYILPGIPEPRSVVGGASGPEDALGQQSQQKKGVSETRFGTEVDIKRFQLTVIHDEKLPKEALDTAKKMIDEALLPYKVKKKNPPTVVFKPARFKTGSMLDDLKRPGVYLPLLYAFLLLLSLLFLFGPLSSFLKKYTSAIMAKPAAEVNVENKTEGEGGGEGGAGGGAGAGEGEGHQQIDMMFQQRHEEEEDESMKKFEPFVYINEENLKRLVYLFLLRREEPWVIAVVLSYLKPEFARQVLSMLPLELQSKVAMEAMTVKQLTKEQVRAIDTDIKENVDFVLGGLAKLTGMLEDVDANTRQNILEYLKAQKPALYEKVRKSILTFDDIAHFPDRDMQTIVRGLSTEDMARALQGAAPEISEKFFSNMSKGGTALLKETMDFSRDLTDAQIEEAHTKILDTVKTLEKEGKVAVREQVSGEASMDEVEISAESGRKRRFQDITENTPAAPAPAEQGSAQAAPEPGAPAGQFQQYLDAGISLYNEGRYEESISYLQYAVQGEPSLWQAYQYLGGACYALGRTSEALEYYEKYASESRDPAVREWVDNFKQQAGSR